MSTCIDGSARSSIRSSASHLIAQMKHFWCFQRPDQVELDVVGGEALEQKPALAEQHWHELDLENVEHPGLQALLGCVGAVQQDIPIARGRLGLLRARQDALGHEMHPLVAGGSPGG